MCEKRFKLGNKLWPIVFCLTRGFWDALGINKLFVESLIECTRQHRQFPVLIRFNSLGRGLIEQGFIYSRSKCVWAVFVHIKYGVSVTILDDVAMD